MSPRFSSAAGKSAGRHPWQIRRRAAVLGLLMAAAIAVAWPLTPDDGRDRNGSGVAFAGIAEGGEVVLEWNRDAEAVRTARRATVTITDGGRRETVELDLGWLRNHRLAYRPVSSEATFVLRLESERGEVTETIRVRIPPQPAAGRRMPGSAAVPSLPRAERSPSAGKSHAGGMSVVAVAAGLLVLLVLLQLVRVGRRARAAPNLAVLAPYVMGRAERIPVLIDLVAPPVSAELGPWELLPPPLPTSFPDARPLAGIRSIGTAPIIQSPWHLTEPEMGEPVEWRGGHPGLGATLADAA
jgi:hypothetical protein